MVIEVGESQANGSDAESGAEEAGVEGAAPSAIGAELAEESPASYARIAPRPPKRRPTRSELLGGGDATKAPKRLAAEELHPMTGDSSGVSWDDPEEL
ncbi:hypothetical protein [Myceligenerans pegani]|uniref:Uncharacterized protein n=1 Tax=Myceligenerans pegani TaxID=2776917 RepID=A0ABR9N0J6_9MICO|nr:hypothetical protein [Myceligenerans sp. TRM 65318]MBE1876806.1 hypothetical protein [Myceligenerans sp. TRM 65318]MBE3019077.1 hypothetical protein [Myceligenerans sp. TRM 65318]